MSMSPRSREGHCPSCGGAIRMELPGRHGVVPCPRCDSRLWYSDSEAGVWLSDSGEDADAVLESVADWLALALSSEAEQITYSTSLGKDIGADSLDMAELAVIVAARCDIVMLHKEAMRMRTVGDLVDHLLRNRPVRRPDDRE